MLANTVSRIQPYQQCGCLSCGLCQQLLFAYGTEPWPFSFCWPAVVYGLPFSFRSPANRLIIV